MDIATIMNRVKASQAADDGVKTASASTAPVAPASDELRAALSDALSEADITKTASADQAADVGDGLIKMAQDLSQAEHDVLMKQAQLYGAAVCDGFMVRYGQYDQAAGEVAPTTKVASDDELLGQIKTAAESPEFQKFAEENPELTKEAFTLGYERTWDEMTKQADAEFQQGYDDTMREVHKVAAHCYKSGAVTINNVLQQLSA